MYVSSHYSLSELSLFALSITVQVRYKRIIKINAFSVYIEYNLLVDVI